MGVLGRVGVGVGCAPGEGWCVCRGRGGGGSFMLHCGLHMARQRLLPNFRSCPLKGAAVRPGMS
jgi:hypothetical protein